MKLATILFSSFTLWMVACLVAVDVCLIYIKPLQYVEIGGIVNTDQDPLGVKLDKLTNDRRHADLVLLGSSLGMMLTRADYCMAEHKGDRSKLNHYDTRMEYLEKLFANKLHAPCNSFNLAVPACMISDDSGILDYLIESNRRPQKLLLTLAPRDFVDNHIPPADATTYRHCLERRRQWSNKLLDIASPSISFADKVSGALSEMWRYWRVRSDYRAAVEFISCNFAERAPTLFATANHASYSRDNLKNIKLKFKDTTGIFNDEKLPPAKIQQCLDTYKEAYNPLNRHRMDEQFKFLDSMLERARKEKIDTTVAYMPLTAENLALLPVPVAEEIRRACAANHVSFIDLNHPQLFTSDDFTDGAHLNSRGAAKFCNALTSELSSLNSGNHASGDASQGSTVRSIVSNQRIGTN
jgi:hypothetical protein